MISSKNIRIWPWWWKWTVHAMKAQWFSEVHASVAKWTKPACSCCWRWVGNDTWRWAIHTARSLWMCCHHFLNEALMSQDTIIGLGSKVPGHPAFINNMNSLFFHNLDWPVTFSTPLWDVSPWQRLLNTNRRNKERHTSFCHLYMTDERS